MARRAIFLDRDGVINPYVPHPEFGTVDSPATAAEFSILPCVGEALARVSQLDVLVIVVSNQPGIAKRRFTVSQLDAMTHKMNGLIRAAGGRIDSVYYCRHHPEAALPLYRKDCDCRKPKPGLLHAAIRDWNIDASASYMVGDGVGDILAGQAVGSTTLFVSSRKCYVCDELSRRNARPDFLIRNLLEAVEVIECLENKNATAAGKFTLDNCPMR
jgi:D-glycero-D-manno-heptose 1,7-bisphosphate phosphatase